MQHETVDVGHTMGNTSPPQKRAKRVRKKEKKKEIGLDKNQENELRSCDVDLIVVIEKRAFSPSHFFLLSSQ